MIIIFYFINEKNYVMNCYIDFSRIVLGTLSNHETVIRGGSRPAATTKMERFVIIDNGWKPLTIITKSSILDVAAVLDPPLIMVKHLR